MRKSLWLIVALVLAFGVLGVTPHAQGESSDVAPQVVDTSPARGEELLLSSPIAFYFDQPMDHASVESSLKITPTVKGTFEWPADANDSTVIFHPSAPLQRATEYTFTLDSTAKSKTGVALRDRYEIKLTTTGLLGVSQILPADGTKAVESSATITVFFNRPVVPLLPVEQMSTLPSPISISPAAPGQGTWTNTSIYTFTPNPPLKGGTAYTVTVKKGLTDITGSALPNDVTATFTTLSPTVTEFDPATKTQDVLRDPSLTVTFSQPMDPNATQKAFTLSAPGGASVPGTFTWNDAGNALTFKPSALLDYGSLYNITVDKNTARSTLGAALDQSATASFTTVSAPDIMSTTPGNGDTADPFGGFTVSFTSPMKLDDFKSHVTVDPKPGLTFDDQIDDNKLFYIVGFGPEPSTDYTVTIDVNGLTDIYGTPIKPDAKSKAYTIVGPGKVQIKYTTKGYSPEASLETGGDVGLYSAYAPMTRVYSTHRNISTLNLALSALPLADFMKLVGPQGYDTRSSYQPPTPVRQWTVPVTNPTNILRYDLLTISDKGPSGGQTANVTCVGAPAAQLHVGQDIVVLKDDPTPLRVRSQAGLNGSVIKQVAPGVAFTVIGGPICADKFIWWQVLSKDGAITGWAAEGDPAHYYIGASDTTTPPNAEATTEATQDASQPAQPSLKPGMYWLNFSSPDLPSDSSTINHIMLVATADVTLKTSDHHALAWITDLQSGKPLANVSVTFYGGPDAAQIGAPVSTDANGLAQIDLPAVTDVRYTDAVYAVVNDGKNFGVGVGSWSDGINAYDFNLSPDYNPSDVTAYLYSDRSLYRPGQPVYFRGVVRSRNDVTYSMSGYKTIPVDVFDDQNQDIYSKNVPVDDFGSFVDSFTLDANAPLGDYRIVARPGYVKGQTQTDYAPSMPEFDRDFSVADYRTPEFQVTAKAAQPEVVQGDKVSITVNSSYFFGGAVSNAKVEWYVRTSDFTLDYKGSGNYNFNDFNEDTGPSDSLAPTDNTVAKGEGRTDASGNFIIEVPADLGKATQSQVFEVEADVTDSSDQLVSATTDVTVHQGEFYIGAAPEEYVGTANQPQKIDLITVGWDSQPTPNIDLSLRVVERKWHSVQSIDPETGKSVWNDDVQETPVTDGMAHTDADGKAVYTFTPPHGGVYKVYATSRDSRGNQVTTSAFVWVAGPDYVPWRQQNSNRIDLKVDRTSYKIGDTASILIASPFQGDTTALVTVERGNILKTDVITMTNNSTIYKLPITADMAPNAFVSITLVKGVDATNPVAAFRMGLAEFGVEADRLALNITVTPDKPSAGPRDNVNYKIHVTDYQGKPVKAQVGVGLTDLATLSVLPDTSTPIMDFFYGEQGLGIETSNALTISVDQQTQQIINTIKGGGGGGPESGIFQVRQQFVDTPLWDPNVVTDSNGDATVNVTLPDQLTTWRLDARAVTLPTGEESTTLVGQTTFDLLSTKPVLIRPITPRFYVFGDKGTLSAIVNNNTDQPQDVNVRIDATSAKVTTPTTQTGSIPAKGQMRFDWPVEITGMDPVGVTFYVNTTDNKYTDAAKSAVGQGNDKTLPVLNYAAPETVGTGGVIDKNGGDRTEGIVIPRSLDVQSATLDITVDPSLAASATAALNTLKNYPYQSTEQTISSFLPNIITYRAEQQLGLDQSATKDALTTAINDALQRLYAEQHVDGGWGWFVQDDSNPLVTAYALIGLSEARAQGFDVDPDSIMKATQFVQKALKSLGNQPSKYDLNRQAFLLYALADEGAGDFSASVQLFNVRNNMGIYARAYLAMTFKLLAGDSARYTDPLVSDIVSKGITSATGVHWEEPFDDWINWNTNTRTTAIVIEALLEIQPQNALIPNAVRWLMIARTSDGWETTQETAWAVMALTDWMQVSGDLKPNYSYSVTLDNNPLAQNKTVTPASATDTLSLQTQVTSALQDQASKLTFQRTAGDGTLYYTAHVTVNLPVDQVKPLSRGITITRTYSLLSDKDHKPITQATVGDNIRVTLSIIAPNDLNYVVISDPIPAGTEAVNPDLATSGKVGQAPQLTLNDPLSEGWGWWWFSNTELRDESTVLYATYLPKGTYEYTYTLRAGLAGEYHVIPTTGQETYFPDVYGRSDGALFTILPSADNGAGAAATAAATAQP